MNNQHEEISKEFKKKNYYWKAHTKKIIIQAFIFQIFIDQHMLFSINAITQNSNKIYMLELCRKYNFVLEFLESLC